MRVSDSLPLFWTEIFQTISRFQQLRLQGNCQSEWVLQDNYKSWQKQNWSPSKLQSNIPVTISGKYAHRIDPIVSKIKNLQKLQKTSSKHLSYLSGKHASQTFLICHWAKWPRPQWEHCLCRQPKEYGAFHEKCYKWAWLTRACALDRVCIVCLRKFYFTGSIFNLGTV